MDETELQTAAGTRWFRFAELERSLRATNALQPRQGAESSTETRGVGAVTFAAE